MKTLAQGRPMGILLYILEVPCDGDPDVHRDHLDPALATHKLRLAARVGALSTAAGMRKFARLFEREREPNVGDKDGEPFEPP